MEPVDAVCCRPGLVAMSVQSMDGNDTGMKSDQALATVRNNLLYDRLFSFHHHLEALEGCLFMISYKTRVNIVVSTPNSLTCLPFFKSTIGS